MVRGGDDRQDQCCQRQQPSHQSSNLDHAHALRQQQEEEEDDEDADEEEDEEVEEDVEQEGDDGEGIRAETASVHHYMHSQQHQQKKKKARVAGVQRRQHDCDGLTSVGRRLLFRRRDSSPEAAGVTDRPLHHLPGDPDAKIHYGRPPPVPFPRRKSAAGKSAAASTLASLLLSRLTDENNLSPSLSLFRLVIKS